MRNVVMRAAPSAQAAPRDGAALIRQLLEMASAADNAQDARQAITAAAAVAEALCQQAVSERDAAVAEAGRAAAQRAKLEEVSEDMAQARLRLEGEHMYLEELRREDAKPRRSKPPRPPVGDIPGQDLRPDPGAAKDAAGFVEALRQFRTWAGNPSFRDMERACGGRPAASTMCKTLARAELPSRFDTVAAIITACGGGDEDRQRFATAWRRLTLPRPAAARADPGRLRPVPVPGPSVVRRPASA